ncbi:MAG TPA: SidE phosphodiesterase domain-containing protein [Alphaproteobacteria bacterium]|nr:SidE phosphodiesterase domain-containing protein [Alphaproteobacteria bacterium]
MKILFKLHLVFAFASVFSVNTSQNTFAAHSKNQIDFSDSYSESISLARCTNQFFGKSYKDDAFVFNRPNLNLITRKIDGKVYKVYRKRHGLEHGVRQGFLAVDIIDAFNETSKRNPLSFKNDKSKDFANWISQKLKNDPYFTQKVQFVANFQRTGRESEASGQTHPQLYTSYLLADANNFLGIAQKYVGTGKLFKDAYELQVYKEALLPPNLGQIDDTQNRDLLYLRTILRASHMFDLRRAPLVDVNIIEDVLLKDLFGEKDLIKKLWKRTGEYLKASGDRDVVSRKMNFSNRFFLLSNNPDKLVRVLWNARKKSAVKF